jgi:hypothetical protein
MLGATLVCNHVFAGVVVTAVQRTETFAELSLFCTIGPSNLVKSDEIR